jgi:hypothetical protein
MGFILSNASLPSGVHVTSVIGIRQRGMFSFALLSTDDFLKTLTVFDMSAHTLLALVLQDYRPTRPSIVAH